MGVKENDGITLGGEKNRGLVWGGGKLEGLPPYLRDEDAEEVARGRRKAQKVRCLQSPGGSVRGINTHMRAGFSIKRVRGDLTEGSPREKCTQWG